MYLLTHTLLLHCTLLWHADRRFKQIDSLRQYFPTVRERQKDAIYEVPVLLPTKTQITLRVSDRCAFRATHARHTLMLVLFRFVGVGSLLTTRLR